MGHGYVKVDVNGNVQEIIIDQESYKLHCLINRLECVLYVYKGFAN